MIIGIIFVILLVFHKARSNYFSFIEMEETYKKSKLKDDNYLKKLI